MTGKLVRDKIPEIIRKSNSIPKTHIANDKEYFEKLIQKLKEEINEFIETPNKEELADILEVTDALTKLKEFNIKDVNKIKKEKAKKRGKFEKKIILEN